MSLSNQELQSIKQRFGIIGNSPKLNYAIEVAAQVAPTNMTVMVNGESGTGKESFSKIIHQMSTRKHGQFIAINCGAIPEGTIDSELFGHEKGSFTGAQEARKGYFEVTNGGTIFLDEIAEMPLGTQARLLRVLENGEFIRVGSSKVQKTDVRVVAATNVNLLDAVHKGKFREDLYYRLNTVPIVVPALRERGEDVLLLFRKFSTDFSDNYQVKPIKLLPDASNLLLKYPFPGNIRQLKNLAEQVSILEMEREIEGETLLKYLPKDRAATLPLKQEGSQGAGESFSERDILFRILFDLKKEFNELKTLFIQMAKNPEVGEDILKENAGFFNQNNALPLSTLPETIQHIPSNPATLVLEPEPSQNTSQHYRFQEPEKIQDIAHEVEEESLSIFGKEKELIIKALKKYNGKRKMAATDLGISERTLYRKLHEYGIENL